MPPHIDPIPELKRQVATALVAVLARWSAHNAAAWIGADQPRIADLRRGNLARFSLETLIRYLARAHVSVELRFIDAPPLRRGCPARVPVTPPE